MIAQVIEIATLKNCAAETVIFQAHERSHYLQVLRSGMVRPGFTEPGSWQQGDILVSNIKRSRHSAGRHCPARR